VDDGVTLDRDRRRHDQGARALNAGITEIDAGSAGIRAAITGIAGINDIKIGRCAMSLIIFGDTRMAEIIIDPAATAEHVLDAMDLVRLLLAHGVIAAKIVRTQAAPTQPAPPTSRSTIR
jgi:hypothetical protein